MKQILSILSLLLLLVVGCKKVEELPYYEPGTAVTLTANKTSVAPTQADSSAQVITFNWTAPKYANDSSTTKYVLQIDSTGRNFANPTTKEITGGLTTGLTGRELNNLLLNYGFAVGTPVTLDVRVVSSYANNNEQYKSNVMKITVTPFADPSVLMADKTTVTPTLATASGNALTFNWTNSFKEYTGMVSYVLQYDSAGKNFASAQEMTVTAGQLMRALTNGELNAAALGEGVAGGTTGKLDFRVKATTDRGAMAFSNAVAITVNTYVPLLRLYMPGSYQTSTGNGTDWTPANAPELIRDMRPAALNRLYYTYLFLPANAEFKINPARTWDVSYGDAGGGNISTSGGNFKVGAAGWYRVSIDMTNMKFDIREGRMGMVGGATPAGWNPPGIFPSQSMGLLSRNLFLGVLDFGTGGWKFLDNNDWNNSDISVPNARSYGATGPSGNTLVVNGDNMPDVTAAGRYRVIWDGRDPDNVRYEMMRADMMKVVGNGMAGVPEWNPGGSPQMTYLGMGRWQITLNLLAGKEIKFLAGADWGAFDYEDAGGGKIKWDGGPNFNTPGTGTYTITLDERAGTVTFM